MPNSQKGFIWIIPVIIIVLVGVVAAVFLNKGRVVTVEDSKLESLMPTPAKNTAEQLTNSGNNDKLIKFKNDYSLPEGWVATLETSDFMFEEDTRYESLLVKKGDYILDIGKLSGGRANCMLGKSLNDFVILKNQYLGVSTILRDKSPEKTSDPGQLKINVCSDFVETNKFDYGTKLGSIKYYLPKNYDPKILQEMDSIIESLRIVK